MHLCNSSCSERAPRTGPMTLWLLKSPGHPRLSYVVTLLVVLLAFVQLLPILAALGSLGSAVRRRLPGLGEVSTFATPGKSGGKVVIDHDQPFSFALPRRSDEYSKVTISSAVSVPELRTVVFIALDGLNGTQLAAMNLPEGWACEFQRRDGDKVKTMLEMRRAAERLYTTTSIWECPWPRVDDWDRRSVRITGPDRDVRGSGVFSLENPRVPEAGLVACVKPLKNLGQDGETERRLEEYVGHYSSLGFDHFVVYITRDVEDSRTLERFENVTVVRVAPELHEHAYGDSERMNKVQVFFVNDCLWRTRYRATWTSIQFDVDEYVIGTKSLAHELDRLPRKVSHVCFNHRLVKPPYTSPLLTPDLEYIDGHFPTWGKCIVRPEMVDVTWVHGPTAFTGEGFTPKTMPLLHFQQDHYEKHKNLVKNASWSKFTLD